MSVSSFYNFIDKVSFLGFCRINVGYFILICLLQERQIHDYCKFCLHFQVSMVTVLHKICFELLHLIIQKSRNELCRPFFQISQAFFLSLLWSVPGKKGPKKVGILMPSFLFKFSGEMKCLT